jgi:hypothetical protein
MREIFVSFSRIMVFPLYTFFCLDWGGGFYAEPTRQPVRMKTGSLFEMVVIVT